MFYNPKEFLEQDLRYKGPMRRRYDELLEIYSKNQNKDMLLGKTGFGVHHDDYDFVVDNQKLKDYALEVIPDFCGLYVLEKYSESDLIFDKFLSLVNK